MSPSSPNIPLDTLPESERENAKFVRVLLWHLGHYCADVDAAVRLFEFSGSAVLSSDPFDLSQHDLYCRWRFIAARDVATTIYKFQEDMGFIAVNLNRCPTLLALVDHDARRDAGRAFKRHFPSFEGMRHSSAHHGRLYGTPEKMAASVAPGGSMRNALYNDQFCTSFEGKVISLPISPETLRNLEEVRDLYWSAFDAIDPGRAARSL